MNQLKRLLFRVSSLKRKRTLPEHKTLTEGDNLRQFCLEIILPTLNDWEKNPPEVDARYILETAEFYGLIEEVPGGYNPEIHKIYGLEPGDVIFTPTKKLINKQ